MRPKPILPKPGQESVWDYPRPPALQPVTKTIQVHFANTLILQTNRAYRVLETSHPPVYYLPMTDLLSQGYVKRAAGTSHCEWMVASTYYDIVVGGQVAEQAAWCYHEPTKSFAAIKGYLAIYAQKMDKCLVDDVQVEPQPGGFYGGWITPDVVGPFKGVEGSWGW